MCKFIFKLRFIQKSNNLTRRCGFKKVNGFFRMALADIHTLKSNE